MGHRPRPHGWAARIARRPSFGPDIAKQNVIQSLDDMGMHDAIRAAFAPHHAGHNQRAHGLLVDPAGLQMIREET